MSIEHATSEQLQLLLDGMLVPDERVAVERHLRSCVRCRQTFQNLSGLDASLKYMPVERAGKELTNKVLATLNITPRTPFLFRIVESLAYVFGLLIVLGIMLAAFLVIGVINKAEVAHTQSTVSNLGKVVGQEVDSFANGLTVFMQTYLPFVFGSGSLKLAILSTLAIGMLLLFDRFLKRRFHV